MHASSLSPRSNEASITINNRWRVRDDGLQWVVECMIREPKPGKYSGWNAKKFHVERDALIRTIREIGITIGTATVNKLEQLPPINPGFARHGMVRP